MSIYIINPYVIIKKTMKKTISINYYIKRIKIVIILNLVIKIEKKILNNF